MKNEAETMKWNRVMKIQTTALKSYYWSLGAFFTVTYELSYSVFHHKQNKYSSVFILFTAGWRYQFLTMDYSH